ncbi:MAG: cytochrome c oxidase subunit II [Planctomycetaceae bacterium]|nr:cytochrome c oxidase subunit II [Planctomycetaceae bacterium]
MTSPFRMTRRITRHVHAEPEARTMWNFPLFPDQASTIAKHVDALYFFALGIAGFFTAMICVLILAFAARYRRKSTADRLNPPTASRTLEIIWIGGPMLLMLTMFTWAAILFYKMYDPPVDALEVYVVGKQWMWHAQHSEGRAEINELHVPLGRPIRLTMTSQDVIHSFFIPAFRVKQDVLPGRYTTMWFEPAKIGRYHLFCAEYCGTNHSAMGGWVYVMEPVEFQQWLSQAGTGASMAEQGERLFVQYHCAGCHRGSQTVHAPRLEGVYGRPVPVQQGTEVRFTLADYRYIRDSILRPKSEVVAGYEPVMPSFEGQITEPDLLKIIAYIKSIGAKEATQ